jgi:hypothetical protein
VSRCTSHCISHCRRYGSTAFNNLYSPTAGGDDDAPVGDGGGGGTRVLGVHLTVSGTSRIRKKAKA